MFSDPPGAHLSLEVPGPRGGGAVSGRWVQGRELRPRHCPVSVRCLRVAHGPILSCSVLTGPHCVLLCARLRDSETLVLLTPLRVGTFCGSHLVQGLRPSVTDCTQIGFLLPFRLGAGSSRVLPYSGTFTLGGRATGPLFFRVPTGILGFCTSLPHHSELGLGKRTLLIHSPKSKSLTLAFSSFPQA